MNGKKKLIALMKPHKKKYIQAIVLAILGVACGMIPYFAIAAIYLVIVMFLTWVMGKMERRLRQSDLR